MKFLKNLFKKTVPKVIAGILILLFLLSLFVFWGWYVKQVNKVFGLYYVYKGDKAYKAHKLEKAIGFYKTGLERYPEHSLARCNLGNIYVKYEDYYSAVEQYEEVIVEIRIFFDVERVERFAVNGYGVALARGRKAVAVEVHQAHQRQHHRLRQSPFL